MRPPEIRSQHNARHAFTLLKPPPTVAPDLRRPPGRRTVALMFEPWQRELLESLPVARLGTIASDGRPHLVPVCFVLLGDTIVIAIDEKPKRPGVQLARLRNIRRDSRVSLLADRYEGDWLKLAWVRIDGEATIVASGQERPEALAALRLRYPQYGTMALESLPLIEVTPERVTGWRYAPA